jgi:hypothetical protein
MTETAALPGRPFCAPFAIQKLLLVCQRAPRCLHPHEGKLGLLVLSSLGKESAVSSVISKSISHAHTRKMEQRSPLSTESFYEMFVSLGS